MLLGLKYPKDFKLLFVTGVIWEVIEFLLGAVKPKWLDGLGHCLTTDPTTTDEVWWYGKVSDIVANSLGLYVSTLL